MYVCVSVCVGVGRARGGCFLNVHMAYWLLMYHMQAAYMVRTWVLLDILEMDLEAQVGNAELGLQDARDGIAQVLVLLAPEASDRHQLAPRRGLLSRTTTHGHAALQQHHHVLLWLAEDASHRCRGFLKDVGGKKPVDWNVGVEIERGHLNTFRITPQSSV